MHRVTFLFCLFFLSGCTISAAIYKSGVKFEGENVEKDTFGYSVEIRSDKRITLDDSGCGEYTQLSAMMAPLVPLPPVIPVDDGEAKSNKNEMLSFEITSWDGEELKSSVHYLLLSIHGTSSKIEFSDFTRNGDIITYKFHAGIQCGSVKDYLLEVKGFNGNPLIYKINYYEGTELEAGYLSS